MLDFVVDNNLEEEEEEEDDDRFWDRFCSARAYR